MTLEHGPAFALSPATYEMERQRGVLVVAIQLAFLVQPQHCAWGLVCTAAPARRRWPAAPISRPVPATPAGLLNTQASTVSLIVMVLHLVVVFAHFPSYTKRLNILAVQPSTMMVWSGVARNTLMILRNGGTVNVE